MKSTDHNLNNPLKVDTIHIETVLHELKLSASDPVNPYVLSGNPNKSLKCIPKYLLAPSEHFGEYSIYENNNRCLVEICRYSDPQIAIDELMKLNNVGSHNPISIKLYNILCEYIKNDISLYDVILGILSVFGYRDDIKLQKIIHVLESEGINKYLQYRIIKPEMKERVSYSIHMNKLCNDFLFTCYSDLYDLIVYDYEYFQNKDFKKQPDAYNLDIVISKIFKIMKVQQ